MADSTHLGVGGGIEEGSQAPWVLVAAQMRQMAAFGAVFLSRRTESLIEEMSVGSPGEG